MYIGLHKNLGRYTREGAVIEDGASIGTSDRGRFLTKSELKRINEAMAGGKEYLPFDVIPVFTENTGGGNVSDVVVYIAPCTTKDGGKIDAIARLDGNRDQLIVQMCEGFVDEHEGWEANAAAIIKGVFSFGRDATIATKVIEGNVYVVGVGEGTGIGEIPPAYFAPGATTTIRVNVPPGRGIIDGGKYNVKIRSTGDKSCIKSMTVFGGDVQNCSDDGGCTLKLHPLTKKEIVVSFSDDPKCNEPIGIAIRITPNYGEAGPVELELQLLPLEVGFDDLVRALTCP
ncbi:TPA: hypothetical protein EYP13_01080, partial [Candidatus Micrarchaeota archaeon]|nr:hypothetical protein [Candidatus Micrarchaeota archaeon]